LPNARTLGSLAEVETQLLLAAAFEYVNGSDVEEVLKLTDEIGKMLHGLIRSNRPK
jgi:four helix bundle protein